MGAFMSSGYQFRKKILKKKSVPVNESELYASATNVPLYIPNDLHIRKK